MRALATLALLALVSTAGCSSGPPPVIAAIEVPAGWPVAESSATVSSSFGVRRGRPHTGIDLAAAKGTQVRATAGGRVRFAGRSGDYGRMVLVDHGGGWQTLYAHLLGIDVDRGQTVARHTVVGTVGRSGNASGYHLHYEVRYDGRAIDPAGTLRR